MTRINLRWANASTGDDKVVVIGHAFHSFDDLAFVISDDFDTTKIDAQGEAPFGKVSLEEISVASRDGFVGIAFCLRLAELVSTVCLPARQLQCSIKPAIAHLRRTLPPSTSSPMIRHAAVWINPFCCGVVPAMIDDVIEEGIPNLAADECAKFGTGRERCRATC